MLAIIALVAIAIVALIVLSVAVHVLFSPWVLLLGVAILAWISSAAAPPAATCAERAGYLRSRGASAPARVCHGSDARSGVRS
jgi:hypothetical protein